MHKTISHIIAIVLMIKVCEGSLTPFAQLSVNILDSLLQTKSLLTLDGIWRNYQSQNNSLLKLSNLCHQSINEAMSFDNDVWKVQLVDAWGKFPEGVLSGHFGMAGDFEECVKMKGSIHDGDIPEAFTGRYCPVHLLTQSFIASHDMSSIVAGRFEQDGKAMLYSPGKGRELKLNQPTLAVCLPTFCSKQDVNILFAGLTDATNGTFTAITEYCVTDTMPQFDASVYVMIIVSAILLLLVATGTLLDYFQLGREPLIPKELTTSFKIFKAFSAISNFKQLMAVEAGSIMCLHGIRFLSSAWVGLHHIYIEGLSYSSSVWNLVDLNDPPRLRLPMMDYTNTTDAFFTLSAFLLCTQMLRKLDNAEAKFNPLRIYLHRYLRLTPSYLFAMGIVASFLPYLATGPTWATFYMNTSPCKRTLWQNVLYINNFYPHDDDSCFPYGWYMACDFQLYIISVWIVYILARHRRVGLVVLSILSLATLLIPGVSFHVTAEQMENVITLASSKPWNRMGIYCAGIWTGYAHFHTTKNNIKIPSKFIYTGWIILSPIALYTVYGPLHLHQSGVPVSLAESLYFGPMSQTFMGITYGWIIYSCANGYGGFVNKFLSMRIFGPLGHMTFAIYLVSSYVADIFFVNYPIPIYLDSYFQITLFISQLGMSILVAFFLVMFVEYPFLQLQKIFVRK